MARKKKKKLPYWLYILIIIVAILGSDELKSFIGMIIQPIKTTTIPKSASGVSAAPHPAALVTAAVKSSGSERIMG